MRHDSPSIFNDSPIQPPEIFATDKLDSDSDILATGIARRTLPRNSGESLFPRIRPYDVEGLAGFGGMFAPHQRAEPAHQHRFRVLFPGAAKLFRTEPHGDRRHLPRTPPQMTPELAGREDNM